MFMSPARLIACCLEAASAGRRWWLVGMKMGGKRLKAVKRQRQKKAVKRYVSMVATFFFISTGVTRVYVALYHLWRFPQAYRYGCHISNIESTALGAAAWRRDFADISNAAGWRTRAIMAERREAVANARNMVAAWL